LFGTQNIFDFGKGSAGRASMHRAIGRAPIVRARVLRPRLSEFIKEYAATVFIGIKVDGLTADGAGRIGVNEAARIT